MRVTPKPFGAGYAASARVAVALVAVRSASEQFELVTGLTAEPGLAQPFLTEFVHPIRHTCSMCGVVANGCVGRRDAGRAEAEGRDHRPSDQMLHHGGKSIEEGCCAAVELCWRLASFACHEVVSREVRLTPVLLGFHG